MTLSMDEEKVFAKIPYHSFHEKTSNKLGIEGKTP